MIPERTRKLLETAVRSGGLPGAALGVVDAAGERETLILGHAQLQPENVVLQEGFHFDLASLTKPLFTARSVIHAAEEGRLDRHH